MTEAASPDPGPQAEKIAQSGQEVRERVRRLVVDTVEKGRLRLSELRRVTIQVVDGAARGLKGAVPDEQESVLRQVVDGVADGFATAATAAMLAFQEAKGKGESYAQEDIARAKEELSTLEEIFVETVKEETTKAGGGLKDAVKGLTEHARRTIAAAKPSFASALDAAKDHPLDLAGETTAAGIHVTRQAAGTFFHAMSGFMQGAGDLLRGKEPGAEESRRTDDA